MRFNNSFIVLGLAAVVSAVPVAVPPVPDPTAQSNSGVGLNVVNASASGSPSLNARDIGVGQRAADLERREYTVTVTFKQEGGVNPTEESEKEAQEMVKATLKNAARKLKMGQGSELEVKFTNYWPSSFLGKVEFTFQDAICGSGGSGTCQGEATSGGKGTIKNGPKKKRDQKVLWSQVTVVFCGH
ncbi:hypothetical protein F5876DRAFT_68213 [Lentinula aff. lateritia]|uniref:Uncharacterized protein n=1 Tax=Lentinula aff. lateritia TaxID=2804960 RepID=A0ACC1TRW9_9AGAR|nr:hypothetical protein F5876DRAFT_68213 [Lentinula aff. lateritia]